MASRDRYLDERVQSERFSTEHEALTRARELLEEDLSTVVAVCDRAGNLLSGVRLQLIGAGFFGVFLVAAALAGAGLYWVVTLALLGSILAAVGAVRVAYAAFLLDEEDTRAPARAPSTRLLPATFASGAAALLVLVLIGYSLLANPISGLAFQGAAALLSPR
jgi:hypothetical protein